MITIATDVAAEARPEMKSPGPRNSPTSSSTIADSLGSRSMIATRLALPAVPPDLHTDSDTVRAEPDVLHKVAVATTTDEFAGPV